MNQFVVFQKTLTLQLDISMVRYDVREVEIQANITTQSDEANWDDNSYTITVHFDVDIDIAIAGLVHLDDNINLILRFQFSLLFPLGKPKRTCTHIYAKTRRIH